MLTRRRVLAVAGAALAAPAVHAQGAAKTLKFIPHSNLISVDPIWTPAAITRNHGYMVFDTLYAMDAQYRPQPQMAAGHVLEEDGLVWTLTLRDGLRFHDGEPVRAADAVASLQRWMRRAAIGQKLAAFTDELSAPDEKRLRFRLKRRFPRLLEALGHVSAPIPFIMPARLAATDPFKQVREAVGSGPFRFKADEFNPGGFVAYERFADYIPVATGRPSLTAGPKRVWFDRVEWHIVPDAATGAAALQSGGVDWLEAPQPELEPLLAHTSGVAIEPLEDMPRPAMMRINQLHPPFDNQRFRQALLPAVDQRDFMMALVGSDAKSYVADTGIFTPGSPFASHTGLEPLLGPRDVEKAKRMVKDSGYAGQTVRLIGAMDVPAQAALAQVAADLFQRVGLNLDFVATDWGTLMQRTASKEPIEHGGWSSYCTFFPGLEFVDPGACAILRGNGLAGANGWPNSPRTEALREEWFEATDLTTQQRIAGEMQRVAIEEVMFIPLGAYTSNTAIKRELTGRVAGMPIFWALQRA